MKEIGGKMKKIIFMIMLTIAALSLFAAETGGTTFTLPVQTSLSLGTCTDATTWTLETAGSYNNYWKSNDLTQKINYSTTAVDVAKRITVTKTATTDVLIIFTNAPTAGLVENDTYADGLAGSSYNLGTFSTKTLDDASSTVNLITGIKACTVDELELDFNIGFIQAKSLTINYTIIDEVL